MSRTAPPSAAPEFDAARIDAVVREVVRRLLQAGGEESGTGKPALKPTAAASPAPGVITVPERLVTLATIADWLDGLERVIVRPDAVVTPAVVDELRRRGIKLSRGTGSLQSSPSPGQLLLAAAETNACPQAISRQLGPLVRVLPNRDQEPLPTLLPKLLAEMKQHSARGVLLTDHPEAALCEANALPNVRAAEGRRPPRLAKVLDRLNPNLLLLDGHERNPYEIRRLIQQFHRFKS